MPTTALTVSALPGLYSTTGSVPTLNSSDAANGNHFDFGGDVMIVIVQNTGVGARTVTITSEPGPLTGRLGNVAAQSLAAGEIRVFRLARTGWANANNQVAISGSHAEVKIAVLSF